MNGLQYQEIICIGMPTGYTYILTEISYWLRILNHQSVSLFHIKINLKLILHSHVVWIPWSTFCIVMLFKYLEAHSALSCCLNILKLILHCHVWITWSSLWSCCLNSFLFNYHHFILIYCVYKHMFIDGTWCKSYTCMCTHIRACVLISFPNFIFAIFIFTL